MKNKYYVSILLVVAALIVGGLVFFGRYSHKNIDQPIKLISTPATTDNTYIFNCPDGRSITATFYLPQDKNVGLKLSDGRVLNLPHAISADGARYANPDESFVFWNKGDAAFIEENGTTTFSDCAIDSDNSGNEQAATSSPVATYTNDKYKFELTYPAEFKPETTFKQYYHLQNFWRVNALAEGQGKLIIAIPVFRIDQGSVATGKPYPLYFDAEVRVGVSADAKDVADCYANDPGFTNQKITDVVIGGLTFKKFDFADEAMMQYVQGESYRIVHNNMCYAIEQIKTGSVYRDETMKPGISDTQLNSYYDEAGNIALSFRFFQ